MTLEMVAAGELMVRGGGSVDPSKSPDEVFDLLSIPAFDRCQVEVLSGKEIGSSKCRVQEGDVLLSKIIPHIRRCWVVPKSRGRRQIGSGEWIIFRSQKHDPNYLRHFLTSDDFHRQFMSTVAGVGGSLVRARPAAVEKIAVPLPPLAEQKRIAAILDKADAIRRKRQQAIALTDQLLRSVFLDMFGDPVTNPKRWKIRQLKEFCHVQIGPFGTQLHKQDYVENGIPLVNPTHIVSGKIVPSMRLTITEKKHADLPEYHLAAGDVVMGRRGEMGRCALVSQKECGWLCGTGSLFIRPENPGPLSEYLYNFLSSSAMKRYLESEALGATLPNLNKGIIERIDVPVPDEEALHRYSAFRRGFETLRAKLEVANESLLAETLARTAFAGEMSKG